MTNKRILPNLYRRYNVYYYVARVDKKLKWIRLSSDYQEALHKYADLRGDSSADGTVAGAIRKYRSEVLPELAPKTQEDRAYQLDRLDRVFGKMQLDSVKPPHIQTYLHKHEHKVAANREIKLLSQIYRRARVWGQTDSNPCKDVYYHTEKSRDREMTDAEFIHLQEEAAPVIRAVIQVAYLTGMRRGDLLDLRTTDLEDAGIRNRQNKTSKKQYFNWSPSLRAAVNLALSARVTPKVRKINEPKWLFTNRKGQQVTRTGFNSAWRRLRDKCSIEDLHFHDIRGKAATDAKRKGGIEYAQSLLGHDNISQTESYIQSKSTESVEPVK